MYVIAALIYLVAAGQQIGEPLKILHRDTFKSLDACQGYLKSEEFGAERDALSTRIKARLATLRQPAPAGDEDEVPSPLPDIAITASCEQDPRV